MSDKSLKACPFCGGEASKIPAGRGYGISVGCTQCGADIMRVDEDDVTNANKAIKAWNTRTTTEKDAVIDAGRAVVSADERRAHHLGVCIVHLQDALKELDKSKGEK